MCSKAGPGMKQSVVGHQVRKATCPCLFNKFYRLGLLGLLGLSSTSSNEGSVDNSIRSYRTNSYKLKLVKKLQVYDF